MRHARLACRAIALAGLLSSPGGAEGEVVAVVSAKSPVAPLTRHQVADIFLGKATRFPGGSLALPIDQAEGSAARDEFYLAFAGKSAAQLNAHWSKLVFTGRGRPPPVAAGIAALKRRLADNPDAIGYLDEGLLDGSMKVLARP